MVSHVTNSYLKKARFLGRVLSDVANLHHASVAIEGSAVGVARLLHVLAVSDKTKSRYYGRTYPVATDSNVKNEEEGAVSNVVPDVLVANAGTGDLEEVGAVERPGEGLGLPAAGGAVDLNTPRVPVVDVGDVDRASNTVTLVADTAGVDVAVKGTVAGSLAVDSLHDVDLTTVGPAAARLTEGVTQHPESRPDTLLVGLSVAAEADGGFKTGDPAGLRSECVLGLKTTRGPAAKGAGSLAAIPPGDQLQGASTAELNIGGAGGVGLLLGVDVQVSGDDVPVVLVRRSATVASEGVSPDQVPAAVGRGLPGVGSTNKGEDGGSNLGRPHFVYVSKRG